MDRRTKAERTESSEDQSLIIKDCKVWTPDGVRDASILIRHGRVSQVAHNVPATTSNQVNGKHLLALPGLIDVHVHLRGMLLSYKEDFTSGTAAAAAGGFTSVLDMPNTRPVTDSPRRLSEKMENAASRVLVNVGFHVAAVAGSSSISRMAGQGAFSLKLYLPNPFSPLRVESDETVLTFLRTAAENRITVTVHAEEADAMHDASQVRSYVDLAKTRPPEAESKAVDRMLSLQGLARCSMHFAHLTLPSSLHALRKKAARSVSSEVTPHHLLLSEAALRRSGWRAWMVPPLRRKEIQERLLQLVARGTGSVIASDHAPHSLAEKSKSVARSPPGVPGLETTLPLLLTLVNKGALSIRRLVELLSTNPALLFGLSSKGGLANGMDGDVVLVDLKKRGKIISENFFSKAKYSPFEGFGTRGMVQTTIVGGRVVYDRGEIVAKPGSGNILRRHR